jgi:hypothetical protein
MIPPFWFGISRAPRFHFGALGQERQISKLGVLEFKSAKHPKTLKTRTWRPCPSPQWVGALEWVEWSSKMPYLVVYILPNLTIYPL